jgi:signal transduction histidine kinase
MRQRNVLVGLIAVSLAAVAAFTLYNALYLAPAYSRLVVESAQKDAERVAVHLSAQFFGKSGLLASLENTPAFRAAVADHLAGYNLERLKAFAPDGTIVFSTVPSEEGTRNTKPYFLEIVARGRAHSVVVPRNGRTLDERPVRVDVVETYVPVMRGGRFAGAFETYHDVTGQMEKAEDLLARSNLIVLLMAGALVAAAAVASRRAVLAIRERDQAARALQQERDRLEGMVAERTEALRSSHDNLELLVAERSAALETANRNLHDLSGHLHIAREEERTRVAREIHDELGQSLTAMRMELSLLRRGLSAEQRQAIERAESLSALVESTTQVVKRISQDLRPGILDHLGLPAAVEWHAEEFERRTGIPCAVTVDPVDMVLDEQRSTALFRILQESLTNVARHANARGVNVLLRRGETDIELQVQDDGRGMDGRNAAAGSFGIIGMQERVRSWGGTVTVDGAPGRGTTVTTRLPANKERRRDPTARR